MTSSPHISFSQVGPLADAVRLLRRIGVPVDTLLARAGFPTTVLELRPGIAPLAPFLRFVELVATTQGIPDLGAQIGLCAASNAQGQLARIVVNTQSLGRMVHRSVRCLSRFASGARFWIGRDAEHLFFNWSGLDRTEGRIHADSYVLAIALRNVRSFLGDAWAPPWATLCAPPDAIGPFASALGIEIRPTSCHNSLALPLSLLGAGPSRVVEPVDDKLDDVALPDEFVEQVRCFIDTALSDGLATAQIAAQASGISLRSFQRALRSRGHTFDGLVESSRMNAAQRLLTGGALPIVDVALTLGYSDASNFTRAFRRNFGIAPSEWRRLTGIATVGNPSAPLAHATR